MLIVNFPLGLKRKLRRYSFLVHTVNFTHSQNPITSGLQDVFITQLQIEQIDFKWDSYHLYFSAIFMKFLGIVTVEKQPVNNILITPSKRRVLHVWYLPNFGSNLYLRRVQQKKIAAAGIQNNIDKILFVLSKS